MSGFFLSEIYVPRRQPASGRA